MAEAQTEKRPSLSEQYLLKEKEEKSDVATKAADAKDVENPVNASSGEVFIEKVETPAASVEESTEAPPAPVEESTEAPPPAAAEESTEANTTAENSAEDASAAAEESTEPTSEENSGDAEETPEIKLETAPADFRFPTTNQTRHCFTRYIEYHRCVAAKGEGASECDKFAKYYRALCPGEWIDRWNEQRENGTFPGPL
ncbi:cytochrome c oxidase subunit 6b-1-like [Durio zibethinus]|uniref:Cytochrome c oxidase subunit 6b-1-like n=1 Tax=Durio zibethinus TaxID=66656 RepID=A0A6P5YB56_DURZI|nr:cytochrome c oxidase subunit 6b-1-like [Durio zibethinus]